MKSLYRFTQFLLVAVYVMLGYAGTLAAQSNTLLVSSTSLSFAYQAGGAAPAPQTLSVSSSGTSLAFTAAASTCPSFSRFRPHGTTDPCALVEWVSITSDHVSAGRKTGLALRDYQEITMSTSGQEFVVPIAMKPVSPELEFRHLLIGNFDPRRIDVGVDFAFHGQSCRRCGAGDEVDDDLVTDQRLARQFWLMKENRRCSILFHLLVPGGKWQTEISSPVSSASFCNSHFHSLTRAPLLPPESAVINRRLACG